MSESIRERVQTKAPAFSAYDQRLLLEAVLADLTALRTAFVTLTAKLDADAANTALNDTDYAATCDPAALTLTD